MPPKATTTLSIDERLNDQSRRIRMLEEVFVPMAKASMEILIGKNGEPGMAEDLRGVRNDLRELVIAHDDERKETERVRSDGFKRIGQLEKWKEATEATHQVDKEIRLMGIKVSSEMKIAIINGAFIILGTVVAWWFSK